MRPANYCFSHPRRDWSARCLGDRKNLSGFTRDKSRGQVEAEERTPGVVVER